MSKMEEGLKALREIYTAIIGNVTTEPMVAQENYSNNKVNSNRRRNNLIYPTRFRGKVLRIINPDYIFLGGAR